MHGIINKLLAKYYFAIYYSGGIGLKIAVLYICTGQYVKFWDGFYESAQEYLLTGHEKHYFVFTDSDQLPFTEDPHVHKVYQSKLGWPYDTLMRFEMFLKVEAELKGFDYIYFFNANMIFVDEVGEEIFPGESDNGLTAATHPCFYKEKNPDKFTYDRNPASTAYIPLGQGERYFPGGLYGGKTEAFLTLVKTLDANVKTDLQNNVMAKWHDESHLNRYLLGKNVKILSPAYIYPEGFKMDFKIKILLRDKKKWGGHKTLRNGEKPPAVMSQRIKSFFQGILKKQH